MRKGNSDGRVQAPERIPEGVPTLPKRVPRQSPRWRSSDTAGPAQNWKSPAPFPISGKNRPWSEIMAQAPSSSPTATCDASSARIMISPIMGRGDPFTPSEMARVMVRLQEIGCHNINFVTPTHYVPQIVSSLPEAIEMGLRLPIVYNCSGYESVEVIRLLEDIVDIYMPDVKFMDGTYSGKILQCAGLSRGDQEGPRRNAPPGGGSYSKFRWGCRKGPPHPASGDARGSRFF